MFSPLRKRLMTWAPYGENTADDRERMAIWLEFAPADENGWVSFHAIRAAFKGAKRNWLNSDLRALMDRGLVEKEMRGEGRSVTRPVFYRYIDEASDA